MKKVGFRKGKMWVRWDSDGFFNGLSVMFLGLALIAAIIILIFFPNSGKDPWEVAVAFPGLLGIGFGILYFTVERNEKSRI